MKNRLELDTGALKENTENYTSLTDLSNLQLFTDDFEKIIEKKQKEAENIEEILREGCFADRNTGNISDEIISSMFQSTQVMVSRREEQVVDYGNYYIFLGSVLLGILICSIVFGVMNRKGMN